MYYVYLLKEENSGNWKLIYYEAYKSKDDAIDRERKLKQNGRSKRYIFERTKRSQEII